MRSSAEDKHGIGWWFVDHVVGVNTAFIWIAVLVAGGLIHDPVAGAATHGPAWLSPAIITGAILVAWSYWRVALSYRQERDDSSRLR